MNPFYKDHLLTVYHSDVMDGLRELPNCSVHCCVTSPPYWGLRDYGVDGQIGLEKTPEEYVAKMVAVFREVKRVLRDDGTLWLNLGDCYIHDRFSSPMKGDYSGDDGLYQRRADPVGIQPKRTEASGLKTKDLCGIPWRVAFALQQPYSVPTCVKSEIDRAWLAAMFDGEGCIGIRRFASYRKEKQQVYQDGFVVYTVVTNNDIELLQKCERITGLGRIALKQSAGSTDGRGIVSRRDSFGWRPEGNAAVDVVRAIYPYLIAKRKQACIAYTLDQLNKNGHGSRAVPAEVQEKKAYLWGLVKACNQRRAVDLPDWIKEPAQKIEPGWYLRSDIIWHKPNPMPESVTDRPTKAHEYIFLMSKNARYYYDAEAVKEPMDSEPSSRDKAAEGYHANYPNGERFSSGERVWGNGTRNKRTAWTVSEDEWQQFLEWKRLHSRDKKDDWTVPTQCYPESHFATFPEDLIKPCILAGCPVGGTVLDPFGGSFTTAQVSLELGRKSVIIEINPAYVKLGMERTHITPSLPLA